MTRLSFFLLLAVMASALYLVNVQYESRQIYSDPVSYTHLTLPTKA